MKATHTIQCWFRWHGARKFKKSSQLYSAYVKKNGIVVYWTGAGSSSNAYRSYFQNEADANTVRTGRSEDFGRVRKYQTYFTLKKL